MRGETDLQIFVQNEWLASALPEKTEENILRIVQECLANIRKHSQAHSVRIILRSPRSGEDCYILIEDDGIGFDMQEVTARDSEHFGLSILNDRAGEIGAEILLESEPGEGTRVTLRCNQSRHDVDKPVTPAP